MSETVIRTTIDDLPQALAPYAGATRVEIRILDAVDDDRRATLRKLIQDSLDDPRPNIPAEDVFAAAKQRIREKLKVSGER